MPKKETIVFEAPAKIRIETWVDKKGVTFLKVRLEKLEGRSV